MANSESNFYREKEARARELAEKAQTRSIQLLQLKSAEYYGGLALDAKQNFVTSIQNLAK